MWTRLNLCRADRARRQTEASDMLRAAYWFVAGALIGFGVLAILSIGALFLLAGLILVVIGAIRVGARGLWAGLVGFGLLPMVILVGDLSGPGPIEPASTAQAYHMLAITFGAIALLGVLWGLVATIRGPRTKGDGRPPRG
jgi:hypothetical protein